MVKGYEYAIAEGEITAASCATGAVAIPLSRWSSIARRGWYSGDIHIHHISPKTCRLEMEAEDLNVANILTSDFTADQDQFEGRPERALEPRPAGVRHAGVSQSTISATCAC